MRPYATASTIACALGLLALVVPAHAKDLLVVTMSATISGGSRPIVTGRTNLPDGTQLAVELAHPCDQDQQRRFLELDRGKYFPTCINQQDLIAAETDVVVTKGQFKTGAWWHASTTKPPGGVGAGLSVTPGPYVIYVYTRELELFQPPAVRAVIGDEGQNLAGPLISRNMGVGVSWYTYVTVQ
jgi:hypothetical protein